MKKSLILVLTCGSLLAFAVVIKSGRTNANPPPAVSRQPADADAERISGLLDEMKTASLSELAPLPAERFALPPAGVAVMRVRLEETYEIKGVGRDTVELTGWIAARHDNPRPAEGETEVRWGTAVVDTEFVGLELRGESKVFGPVLIHLDPEHRSVGQVGNLGIPFVEQIALDAAYRGLRPLSPAPSGEAAEAPPQDEEKPTRGSREDEAAIRRVMQGVWGAISRLDAEALLRYYAPGSKTVKGGVEEVAKHFANVRSIKVTPNNDLRVRFMGRFANVTATGKNEVVDKEGKTGSSNWKANVQLERSGSDWLITQDRTSLFPNPGGNMRGTGGKCLAKISVTVEMPHLALRMRTKDPVTWYSEVETIPPVGYTASVSMTPTPMISAGREVATLRHGAVKFREVVRRIPLEGTNWNRAAAGR